MKGFFVISLDLEKMYGVFDSKTIVNYGSNIEGVREVVPKILNLFEQYNISATWAFVGMMLFYNKEELLRFSPKERINYSEMKHSIYSCLRTINQSDFELYFEGSEIIKIISNSAKQELASHTYSHSYCLEPGFDLRVFKEEMKFKINLFREKFNRELKSMVFPRNQYSEEVIATLKELGFVSYRGNIDSWLHHSRSEREISFLIKVFRFFNSYLNLFPNLEANYHLKGGVDVVNIEASAFFRPYNSKIKILERLKINRIKRSMLKAAKNRKLFHLWWHPHNFGINQNENLKQLEEILAYYRILEEKYDFMNITMGDLGEDIHNGKLHLR